MLNQTDSPDTPGEQENPGASEATKETKLNRMANQAASRAAKRQQRYDKEHNIFTN
jgi:hypothetical protein